MTMSVQNHLTTTNKAHPRVDALAFFLIGSMYVLPLYLGFVNVRDFAIKVGYGNAHANIFALFIEAGVAVFGVLAYRYATTSDGKQERLSKIALWFFAILSIGLNVANADTENSFSILFHALPPLIAAIAFEYAMMLIAVRNETQKSSARTRDESARTQEELSRTRDELARTQEELSRTRDESARTQEELSRTRDEAARTQEELSRTRDEAARTRDDFSRTQEELSRTRDDVARTRDDLSRTQEELSRTRDELARTQEELLRTRNESSHTQQELVRTREVATRNQTATQENSRLKTEAQKWREHQEAWAKLPEPFRILVEEVVAEDGQIPAVSHSGIANSALQRLAQSLLRVK